jgi:hypothetical protein
MVFLLKDSIIVFLWRNWGKYNEVTKIRTQNLQNTIQVRSQLSRDVCRGIIWTRKLLPNI